ncbi:MAG: hypothetical protein Q9206_002325 [Seirophora lacunosa]
MHCAASSPLRIWVTDELATGVPMDRLGCRFTKDRTEELAAMTLPVNFWLGGKSGRYVDNCGTNLNVLTNRDPDRWLLSIEKLYTIIEWKSMTVLAHFDQDIGKYLSSLQMAIASWTYSDSDWQSRSQLRAGDGREPLCAFLEKPVPAERYPFVNAGNELFHIHYALVAVTAVSLIVKGLVWVAPVTVVLFGVWKYYMDKLSERHGPHVDPSHRAAGTALAVDFLDALENASKGGPGQSKGEDDIAVIGIVIKFPGDATSTDSFWNMLMDRRSALSDVPKDRYNNIDAFWSPGAFEPGTAQRKQNVWMDPQQRWLLETAYNALENETQDHKRKIVPLVNLRQYWRIVSAGSATPEALSIAIDTACSSSLNALEFACQGIRNGQSTMGVVAGSNIILGPETSAALADLGFLSPNSKCYSFYHRANGYARGEGIAVAIVKGSYRMATPSEQ